jgi:hypothetical protein
MNTGNQGGGSVVSRRSLTFLLYEEVRGEKQGSDHATLSAIGGLTGLLR